MSSQGATGTPRPDDASPVGAPSDEPDVDADEVLVVVSGRGRSAVGPVGLDGPVAARPLAATAVDEPVPVDG